MSKQQLIFKETYKGWVSFLTYHPDAYGRIGNKFFTIKDGQVWEHNDLASEYRNNFYNEVHTCKLNFFINPPENEEVIFKTVKLEGNDPWDLHIKTNYTQGEILESEFNLRESNYYAHFRKNETETDLAGLKTNGIGTLKSIDNNRLYFGYIPDDLNNGDKIFCNVGTLINYVGTVENIGVDYIELLDLQGTLVIDEFFFSTKDSRVEGSDLRGYYADVTITNDNMFSVELFAVNTNVVKSYV